MDAHSNCLEKQRALKELFLKCPTNEAKYQKIIEIGKTLPLLPSELRTEANLVRGCQSLLYLKTFLTNGLLHFQVYSEALISAGLAQLLIQIYQGERPETLLKCPPTFLEEIGIQASLTPGRSNGLFSLYLRMKQDALKFIVS